MFVEALDKRFSNVCELDLIFHVDQARQHRPATAHIVAQAYNILDEVILGGLVLETSLTEINIHAEAQSKLEKAEVHMRDFKPPITIMQTPTTFASAMGRLTGSKK